MFLEKLKSDKSRSVAMRQKIISNSKNENNVPPIKNEPFDVEKQDVSSDGTHSVV